MRDCVHRCRRGTRTSGRQRAELRRVIPREAPLVMDEVGVLKRNLLSRYREEAAPV